MSSFPANGSKPASVLPVHVVEDHNEALTHIYRAIACKRLPFNGTLLLHFDAHPDLLSPDIQADDVSKKDLLFGSVSIADWILPAVSMGHLGRVVWVKPPWANQIPDGSYHLCVGKDRIGGHLRVSSPLPYFISELLSVSKDQLENPTNIMLDVITLSPAPVQSGLNLQSGSLQTQTSLSPKRSASEIGAPSTRIAILPPAKRMKLSCEALSSEVSQCVCETCCQWCFNTNLLNIINSAPAWILDVDLDFFSTGNPYRSAFSEEQYELLQRLYQLDEPVGDHHEAVRACVERRRRQLDCLEKMWAETEVTREMKLELNLNLYDEILIGEMKGLLGTIQNDSFIDTEYLHISGMMTDLPVHVSSDEELTGLMSTVTANLGKISKKPSVVTISRSTEDEYTPAAQVDTIQQLVLDMLHSLYGNGASRCRAPSPGKRASPLETQPSPDHQNPQQHNRCRRVSSPNGQQNPQGPAINSQHSDRHKGSETKPSHDHRKRESPLLSKPYDHQGAQNDPKGRSHNPHCTAVSPGKRAPETPDTQDHREAHHCSEGRSHNPHCTAVSPGKRAPHHCSEGGSHNPHCTAVSPDKTIAGCRLKACRTSHDPHHSDRASSPSNRTLPSAPQNLTRASCDLLVYHHYNTKPPTTPSETGEEPPGDICDCTYL